jgi:ribonuclease E
VPKTAETRPERGSQPIEAGDGSREPPAADHRVERLSEEPDAPESRDALDVSSQGSGLAAGEAEAAPDEEPEAEGAPAEGNGRGEPREGGPDAQGERRGRRRGRRGGRRRRGRHREGEGAPGESYNDTPREPPRESTLGPFGEEQAPLAQAAADQPQGERDAEPAREAPAERFESERYAPAEPARVPEPVAAHESREARELQPAEERAPAAAERREPAPAPAPEPPPPPAEPPSPPRRGWWNLRRN